MYIMYKTPEESKKEMHLKLLTLIGAVAILLFIGTFVYHFTEGWGLLDSLYFSALSLTSRGFSDLRPTGVISTLFSIIYLFIGTGIIIYAISSLVSYYNSYYEAKLNKAISGMKKPKKQSWIVLRQKKQG